MTAPVIDEHDVTVYLGDVRERLAELDAGSVQCAVTSPPYYGLRDYGVDGQIGLEPSPAEYVAEMVAVFAEVKRVLADDGVLWLNLGDSYSTGGAPVDEYKRGIQREMGELARSPETGIGPGIVSPR
jgi:DNA modification methylase